MAAENGRVALVVGTFDTKGAELRYAAELVAAAGTPVRTVDVSTGEHDEKGVDVTAAEVAASHPGGPGAVFTGDRGTAVSAMAVAFERFLAGRGDVAGVLGLGGSGGTAMIAPALRALPVGVPKLIVSTVAAGDVAPYVGVSDLTMMHSVTDVAGLNRISRQVIGNAAHALAGMVAHPIPPAEDRPAVALTMFGVTTTCVTTVAERLSADHDTLVFHAVGTGGRAMEALVGDGLINAVLDITTTEICDLIGGGVFSAGPERLDVFARADVPYVGSCGALDMVNFGSRGTVPERYADRLFYEHNAQVTLMRTSPDECREIAAFIAAKLNAMDGPVRFLLPEGGVSALDAPGMPFWDPEADRVLFETLEARVVQTADRRLVRSPHNINDPEFAAALVAAFQEVSR
ncbi:Tm-1-like ATP-binding domain-containing protein [Spirillospora sp. NPDC052269]